MATRDVGAGDMLTGAKLGETKHLPPTLTLQYYPMRSPSAWPCFYTVPFYFQILNKKMQSQSSAFFNLLPHARMASGALILTLA